MTLPIIVLAGVAEPLPDWAQQLRDGLAGTYAFKMRREREGYVSSLADDLAALVIVDGGVEDWRFWTATAKSSPATRRIPVLLVSDDDSLRALALKAGADVVLSSAELLRNPTRTLGDYARIHDPGRAEQLACECQQPLPALFAGSGPGRRGDQRGVDRGPVALGHADEVLLVGVEVPLGARVRVDLPTPPRPAG